MTRHPITSSPTSATDPVVREPRPRDSRAAAHHPGATGRCGAKPEIIEMNLGGLYVADDPEDNGSSVNRIGPVFPGVSARSRDYGDVAAPVIGDRRRHLVSPGSMTGAPEPNETGVLPRRGKAVSHARSHAWPRLTERGRAYRCRAGALTCALWAVSSVSTLAESFPNW